MRALPIGVALPVSDEHFDNVSRALAREMVDAGLPESVASAPAALAAARILAGQHPVPVIRELVERYRADEASKPAPKPQAEPTGPEPEHVRIAREAGKVAPTARTAADRVSAVLAGENPWRTGNVTHQALVGHLDPDQAARLKREAGK